MFLPGNILFCSIKCEDAAGKKSFSSCHYDSGGSSILSFCGADSCQFG